MELNSWPYELASISTGQIFPVHSIKDFGDEIEIMIKVNGRVVAAHNDKYEIITMKHKVYQYNIRTKKIDLIITRRYL